MGRVEEIRENSLEAEVREVVARLRRGELRALSRVISAVENRTSQAEPLLKALFPYTGRARTVGVTGAPGSGKSTLVDRLARAYRQLQQTVGVIAVDPTSPFTGGAILGDRIRMQAHSGDAGVYIRSMATRGALGGLARATADVRTVLDASGRDVIVIETVGVGQDEVDVVRLADVNVVVLVPGMGDDVQSLKAGLMETADLFVINKADHDGAERVEREIRAMQSLAPRPDRWSPPILQTVATEGKGVAEVIAAIDQYMHFLMENDLLRARRVAFWRTRLLEMLRDDILERLLRQRNLESALERYAGEVADRGRDPYTVVGELLRERDATLDPCEKMNRESRS